MGIWEVPQLILSVGPNRINYMRLCRAREWQWPLVKGDHGMEETP